MTDIFDDLDLDLELGLTDEEIASFSGKTSVFPHHEILTVDKCIQITGLLPKILEWRAEENAGKHRGGPAPFIDDRTILVALLLLTREHSPLNLTEVGNVLHRRLSDESRDFLRVPHALPPAEGKGGTERKNWFNHAYNGFHRILDVMDPHLDTKGKRRTLMDNAGREAVFTARDLNTMRRRKERLDYFSRRFLQMTFTAQPRRLRRLQRKANISVDQTPIRAYSQRGTKKDPEKKGSEERLVARLTALGT